MADVVVATVYIKGLWPDEDPDEGSYLDQVWLLYVPRQGEDFYVQREFDHFVQARQAHVRVLSATQFASTYELNARPKSWLQLICEPYDDEALEDLRRLWPDKE